MRYGPSTLQLLIFLPTTSMGSPLPTLSSCPRAQGTHRALPDPQSHSDTLRVSYCPLNLILRLCSLSSFPFDFTGPWKGLLSLKDAPRQRQLSANTTFCSSCCCDHRMISDTQGIWDSPCSGQTSPTSTDTSFSPGKPCKGHQERQ